MRVLVVSIVLLFFGNVATAGAYWLGSNGYGADSSLRQQVSLRNGSAGSGRVIVGGGIRGGK